MVRCPACYQETPKHYSHCVHCGAELESGGVVEASLTQPDNEEEIHTLSFHLQELTPEEAVALSDFSGAEVEESHSLFTTHEEVWTQENVSPASFSELTTQESLPAEPTHADNERKGYAFRKLKLLKKPDAQRALVRERTALKKFDAEEWEAIVAEATQQKVPSPLTTAPETASQVTGGREALVVPQAPLALPEKETPPAGLRSDTAVGLRTTPDANEETQEISQLQQWVAENFQQLESEESPEGNDPQPQPLATREMKPVPVKREPTHPGANSPEVTETVSRNPFLEPPVGGVFSSPDLHQPAPTEKIDIRALGALAFRQPRSTAEYGTYEQEEQEELEELSELDRLQEDSIIEIKLGDLETQQTPTPYVPSRPPEVTLPGDAFTPLSPFSVAPTDVQATQIHRSPRQQPALIALVLVQLHVEHGERPHFGQSLSLLEGLSEQVAEVLREAGLHIDQERETEIIGHGVCSRELLQRAFECCQRLLSLVRPPSYHASSSRVKARCAVTTGEGTRVVALESARAEALRWMEVMPSQALWADSRSWFDHQETFPWKEVEVQGQQLTVHELELQPQSNFEAPQQLQDGELPMLGRQQELTRLQEEWQRVQHGRSSLVFLVGESGSGRTRLLEQWRSTLTEPHALFVAAGRWCPKQSVASPYLTSLLESHRDHQGWSSTHGLVDFLSALSDQGHPSMQGWRAFSTDLLAFWDERGLRGRDPVEALRWYIELHTRKQPVLLVIDDLFLLDRSSHRWLTLLMEKQHPRLMMVVLASQGEYEGRFFQVLQKAVTIEVPPLEEQECLQLIQAVAQEHPEVLARAHGMIRESGGNPKLLLSLLTASFHVDSLSDEETLLDQVAVPSAMESSVLKLLKGLDHLERDSLRKAAVVGERFWKGAIESLERLDLAEGGWGLKGGQFVSRVDDRQETLHKLVRRGLITLQSNSAISQEVEYRFSQRLLQQVLLRQYPSTIRRKMHKKVAEWLLLRDHKATLAREVATHLKRGGEVAQASFYLSKAGEDAQAQGNFSDALRLLREALEDTPDQDFTLRLKLLKQLGEVYRAMGEPHSAIHLYQMALQLSWRLSSANDGGDLYLQLGLCFRGQGQFAKAKEAFSNAVTLFEAGHDQESAGLVYQEIARSELLRGKPEEAQLPLQEARKRLNDKDLVHKARFLSVEGHYFRLMAHWARAIQAFQEAGRLVRTRNQPSLLAHLIVQQGELFLTAGDEETAFQLLTEGVELLRGHSAGEELVRALLLGAQSGLLRRDVQASLQWLKEAWDLVQRQPDSPLLLEVAAALSAANAASNHAREAIHFARIAEKKSTQGSLLQQSMIQYYLGTAAAALPSNLVSHMMEAPPKKLPDGGLATYFFVRSLEMLERCSEKARYCMALLALGRSLLRGKHKQAAQNVLLRGLREAKNHGLGLWLERLENQLRLVRGEPQGVQEEAPQADRKGGSTMLVRTPRKRSVGQEKKAFESSPSEQMTDEKPPPRRPLNRPLGKTTATSPATASQPRKPTDSMGSHRNQQISRQVTGKSQGIPPPSSPPPGKRRK